jgi:hypothetical protein
MELLISILSGLLKGLQQLMKLIGSALARAAHQVKVVIVFREAGLQAVGWLCLARRMRAQLHGKSGYFAFGFWIH